MWWTQSTYDHPHDIQGRRLLGDVLRACHDNAGVQTFIVLAHPAILSKPFTSQMCTYYNPFIPFLEMIVFFSCLSWIFGLSCASIKQCRHLAHPIFVLWANGGLFVFMEKYGYGRGLVYKKSASERGSFIIPLNIKATPSLWPPFACRSDLCSCLGYCGKIIE